MMYSGTYAGPWIWLHVHWVFWALACFGFVAALLWLYKFANKKDFLNIIWATLFIGVFGGLLTASLGLTGWNQMMGFDTDEMEEFMEEMMDFDYDDN